MEQPDSISNALTRPSTSSHRRLGDVLIDEGLITPEQAEWASATGERTGSRLGAILVAAGMVRRLTLYRILAREWDLEFVAVADREIDASLCEGLDASRLARESWMPIGETEDGTVQIATSERPDIAFYVTMHETFQRPVDVMVTTDWDIIQGLHRVFGQEMLDEACLGLWRRNAAQSARDVLTRAQKIAFAAIALALVAGLVFATRFTALALITIGSIAFGASVLFKFIVCMRGVRHERDELISADDVVALGDRDLPTFTVLVPVYREANVVADLIENLGRLDYPADRLEILLLLEQDDTETIAAARAAAPPETFTFVIVPDGTPKTKPKACNVGLFLARGDYLVIYDAEDRPEPDQLRKAVIAFRRGGDDLVCVQAALNYWNAEENALTRMFTLEYSYWFDYMLPGLNAYRLPIPLGGTSNHFRTDALRRLGGWDPFNVTEDADLGIRASSLGYTVGVINSTTFEEANRATGNWVRQRSRWIKGYMQTLLVHLRHPIELVRTAGIVQTLAFALLIGGTPITFLLTPPLTALFVLSLLVPSETLTGLFPGWVLWISIFNLVAGNAAMVYVSMMGAFKRRRYRLVMWALLNPLYWWLHAIASYKALWQLITRPHYWEKTLHGLSTVADDAAERRADGHVGHASMAT